MSADWSLLLFIALLMAGAVWIADTLFFKTKRNASTAGPQMVAEPKTVELARFLFPVLFIVLMVRSFVFEPFRIPSASMMPGLVDGDFIVVDKFSYGLRLPILNRKLVPIGEPKRGDVIVFRLPSDQSIHFIKRLVGLPGDRVVVRDNRISINGMSVPLAAAGHYWGEYGFSGAALGAERFGQTEHVVMFAPGRTATDFEATVPQGMYFFMGDNRNDSEDSRFSMVGFVPEVNLVGRAVGIWMNWRIPGWPNWHRIGMSVR
jgi:signal peptidase I